MDLMADRPVMDEYQQRQVALGLREGHADAWRTLYEAYAERVWRCVARLMGPSAADVADVVQEAFLSAARSARSFDPARGCLWGWLWGIARRHVALHYRTKQRLERLERARAAALADGDLARWLDGRQEAPGDALLTEEIGDLVRATLLELPPDYELLLTAKYLDGDSVEVIALRERTTESAVRSKLARARQAFRDAFGKQPILPGDPSVGTHHDPAGR